MITMNLLLREPGETAAGRQYAGRALEIARAVGDQRQTALALAILPGPAFGNDPGDAQRMAAEAIALARQIGDVQLLGELLNVSGIGAPEEQKRTIYLEALSCARQAGDDLIAASEEHMLYGVDLNAGRIEEARAHAEAGVALAERGVGGDFFLSMLRTNLSLVLLIDGDHARAEPLIRQSLLVVRRLGFNAGVSELLVGAACCATWGGDYDRAARLHGAADADIKAALEVGAIRWTKAERSLQDKDQTKLRELLGDESYDTAYRSGTELSPQKAVELALGRTVTA
jgi:non-specific serine/threonine protein kinase